MRRMISESPNQDGHPVGNVFTVAFYIGMTVLILWFMVSCVSGMPD